MRDVGFSLDGTDGQARATTLRLARGEVRTPIYMPVGTQGAVRSVSPDQVAGTGAQILLANTYHLSQRPGEDLVAKAGGLHRFMATELPILTDSGGYQVFSLGNLTRIGDDGVVFRSHVDGRPLAMSPESSIAAQEDLGADIMMGHDPDCRAWIRKYRVAPPEGAEGARGRRTGRRRRG